MYGVIDVGSNTIRLCIYDVSNGEIYPLLLQQILQRV